MNLKLKWIWVVLWTAFIVYALLSPSDGIPLYPWMDFEGFDKLVHVALFGIEAVLLSVALGRESIAYKSMFIFIFCVAFGGALEVIQYLMVESRSGDLLDLMADAVGAALGLQFGQFFLQRQV